ncbi:60S ribosomal protein L36 (nucleomorph) [Cryptomonas paramecium]|uniref:60S ribosomal protein L36 n=1 Tax=Cryptomonas paramaecium TaxID=2898 RepID=F2HIC5_9CRYP|nr:60S ribosomal protein L36 [Cryptomonas paramecium]AEA39049.1 60S ribosomal protein L36 [Cryptomonas paramecium]
MKRTLEKLSKHKIKKVIYNLCNLNPYEKKISELIKLGNEKKALRFGKRKLGTYSRSQKKKQNLDLI